MEQAHGWSGSLGEDFRTGQWVCPPTSDLGSPSMRLQMMRLLAMLLWLLLTVGKTNAAEVRQLDTDYTDGSYRVTFEAVLDALPENVAKVLTDYPSYGALDPRIRSVEVLKTLPDGTVRIRTVIDVCAGIFCRSVKRVENVRHGVGDLTSTVVPERSDMRYGLTHTQWHALDGRTLVRYEARFSPDFWVPGFVRQRYALQELADSTTTLFDNVERVARGR